MNLKKKNYKVGDEVKFDSKADAVITDYAERIGALSEAMKDMAYSINRYKEKMFNAVYEKYPELKNHEIIIDHKKKVARITFKKIRNKTI